MSVEWTCLVAVGQSVKGSYSGYSVFSCSQQRVTSPPVTLPGSRLKNVLFQRASWLEWESARELLPKRLAEVDI